MTNHRLTDADFRAALVSGRAEAETNQAGFLIPRGWVEALQGVPIAELAQMEIWPDGSAIELACRDIHISVDGLLTAILPEMLPKRTVAAIFASRGGRATSEAKRSSAQQNGRKGGRPRKVAS